MNACISERLHIPLRLTRSLSEIVYKKTNGGNAFFVSQLLSSLANQGILTFLYQFIRWEWDKAGVEAATISNDVLKVMVENIYSFHMEISIFSRINHALEEISELKPWMPYQIL